MVREVVKATGDIITVAGDGTAGYSGDGGPATAAELNSPLDIAVDSAGDLFIADTGNNVIREVVKATGDIITVAGNGTAGYSGDGGPATAAELDSPRGLAVDSAGDLFIADNGNNVIREVVKATGDIITVAGNGTAGYSGDGGPATAAELNAPIGVAVDSAGDLFIADYGNNVIREVVKATGDIITVAGNGTAGYSGDGGPATAAELNGPSASPSTPWATCSSPTNTTTWSARWSRRPATSSPSPATARPVTAATADRPPPPSCRPPSASPSIPPATCSLPATTSSASSRPP